MHIYLDLSCLSVQFMILFDSLLYSATGAGRCGCPISDRAILMYVFLSVLK